MNTGDDRAPLLMGPLLQHRHLPHPDQLCRASYSEIVKAQRIPELSHSDILARL